MDGIGGVDGGGVDGIAGPVGGSDSTAQPSPHRTSSSEGLRARFCRFEVCETSERAPSARLSSSLIEILADGARRAGGPAGWEALACYLTGLQEAEVRRVRRLLTGGSDEAPPKPPLGSSVPLPAPRHAEIKRMRALALAELASGADPSNSVGVSASSMVMSGFDPLHEPRLVELLRRLEDKCLTSLQGSFKLPLPPHTAVNVFGQPDPTNSLPEGHVCLVVDGFDLAYQMCDSDGDGQRAAAPEVLIHKSPGCHAGDVRKLRHTRTPQLDALLRGVDRCRAHTVFFSTKGERSIADTIAGCDHDGDKFTVISDPILVRLFAGARPWEKPPRGRKSATTLDTSPHSLQVMTLDGIEPSGSTLRAHAPAQHTARKRPRLTRCTARNLAPWQRQLILQVLKDRYKSSPLVGESANYLMALTDEVGLGDARVQKLIDIYYTALDVGVTGEVLTSIQRNLCTRSWPEWMRGRSRRTDITYRPSPPSSILGRLHGSLLQVLAEASARQSAPVILDPMLHLEGSEQCVPQPFHVCAPALPRAGMCAIGLGSGHAPFGIHSPPRLAFQVSC